MIRRLHLCSSLLVLSCLAAGLVRGQVNLTTYAGGTEGHADGSSQVAALNHPNDVAVGGNGTLYIADTGNHVVRKITTDGQVTTLAGSALESGSANGTGTEARFKSPYGIAVKANGSVVVADSGNHCIRLVSTEGQVSLLAGAPKRPGYIDGTVEAARFDTPYGVAIDAAGTIFIADSGNHVVRSIGTDGLVSTVCGVAGTAGYRDGTVDSALFDTPTGVAVGKDGSIYVTDFGNAAVRKISPGGVVSTLWSPADTSVSPGSPTGISIDAFGTLFIVDTTSSQVVRIGSDGKVSVVAGKGGVSGNADGASTASTLNHPGGIAVGPDQTLFVADTGNASVRKGIVTQFPASGLDVKTPALSRIKAGGSIQFSVTTLGSGFTYSWTKGGTVVSTGNSTFLLADAGAKDAGNYLLTVTDAQGKTLTAGFDLAIDTPDTTIPTTRLVNLSTRTFVGDGANVAIAGFAIRGSQPKQVLIRAAGPALKEFFAIQGALEAPQLTLFEDQVIRATNTGWAGDSAVAQAAAKAGAFAFSENSRDAALLITLPSGNYTAQMSGIDGSAGTALLEVYDADETSSASVLVNLSSRSRVGGAAGTVIAGFVVTGTEGKKILLRASGAALHDVAGLQGTLGSPQLRLFSGNTVLLENRLWDVAGSGAEVKAAAVSVGAFAYLDGSNDAALLVTLPPGAYTAQVSGEGSDEGLSLVEIYDVH